jgi:putative heme-binding domain-containing protein
MTAAARCANRSSPIFAIAPARLTPIIGRVKSPGPLLVFLVVAQYASATLAAQTRAPSAAGASDITAGRRIFDSQCAWCHGAGGEGGTGPNLHGKLRHATDYKSIVDIIISGIPGTEMPSFRSPLTERSARQAAAYVQSLSRAAAPALAGDPQRGATIYELRACNVCHVVSGKGGVLGPELTAIGSSRGPSYLREAIVKPEATHPPGYLVVRAVAADDTVIRGIRVNEDVFFILIRDARGTVHTFKKADLKSLERQTTASLMSSYAEYLSPDELDDLVAYLASLRGGR